ncbi:MAG: TetR family transcriptional regulator [Klenkia sp.]|nr:TetR family transcriptional regulator [Klenkia sp.]
MSTPDGRRARGEGTRGELLDAVRRLVARDGVDAVTHRTVAAEAGVAKTSVAYHFATLDGLLAAALARQTDELLAAVPAVGADLHWLSGRLVEAFAADPDAVRAGYALYLLAGHRPALRASARGWVSLLTDLAAAHTTDPDRARAAVAVVDGWAVQCLVTGAEPDRDGLDRSLAVVLGT